MAHFYEIAPFQTQDGLWSFHTPKDKYPHLPHRKLEENALVAGIDTILDQVAHNFGDDFKLRFSSVEMETTPNVVHEIVLTWTRGHATDPEQGGNWYRTEDGQEGWLCPVLFDYYKVAPKVLYIQIVA